MPEQASNNTRGAPFRNGNFHWLMSGATISMLGDQFTLIALPWLVIKMTGDMMVLGIVLAVMSVPRALLLGRSNGMFMFNFVGIAPIAAASAGCRAAGWYRRAHVFRVRHVLGLRTQTGRQAVDKFLNQTAHRV